MMTLSCRRWMKQMFKFKRIIIIIIIENKSSRTS